tara:strand:- start:669 stop:1370 length:702 start_codon:yes stop_codon:yes gene_type:complete
MKNKLELALVIPVFNEEEIIKTVIKKWLETTKKINSKIIIINDGSIDKTKEIIKSIITKRIILINKKNSGHGPTVTYGYKAALKLKPKYVFQVDSDDQFHSSDFAYFWKNRKNYDFIIGHRFVRNDPLHRLIITRVLKLINLVFFGVYVKDINVPFRLIGFNVLKESMKVITSQNNVPNIFLSLFAFKNFNCHTKIIKHKKRVTGKVILVNFNLIKFCFKSLFELIIFRITKF